MSLLFDFRSDSTSIQKWKIRHRNIDVALRSTTARCVRTPLLRLEDNVRQLPPTNSHSHDRPVERGARGIQATSAELQKRLRTLVWAEVQTGSYQYKKIGENAQRLQHARNAVIRVNGAYLLHLLDRACRLGRLGVPDLRRWC